MTQKEFWQTASNWGFLTGIGLFVVNIIGWAFKLEANIPWMYEFLFFLVICPMILYTGKRNASHAGPEGYSYGRAVGFVFAMMMFAGVVYGMGQFLMYNFIAPHYYGPIIEETFNDFALALISSDPNSPILDIFLENKERYLSMMKNPFMLIISSIIDTVFKGGFLGLVLCAFFYKKPDIFAPETTVPEQKQDDESGSE